MDGTRGNCKQAGASRRQPYCNRLEPGGNVFLVSLYSDPRWPAAGGTLADALMVAAIRRYLHGWRITRALALRRDRLRHRREIEAPAPLPDWIDELHEHTGREFFDRIERIDRTVPRRAPLAIAVGS
jgi:hypothetical protein